MKRSLAAFATLFASLTLSTSAEVRLATGHRSVQLEVQGTSSGPWSAVDEIDSRTLNPRGDLLGHGYPTWRTRDREIVVAWLDQLAGRIVLSRAVEDAWQQLPAIEISAAVTRPIPLLLGDTVVVAWSESEFGQPVIQLASVADSSPSTRLEVGPGLLLDAATIDEQSVALLSMDQGLFLELVTLRVALPNEPIDIFHRQTIELDLGTRVDGGDDSRDRLDLQPELHPIDAGPDSRLLVTWWTSPTELRFLVVSPAGIEVPTTVLQHPGSKAHPTVLIRKALKEASR